MDKLIIVGKNQDFSLIAKKFEELALDVHCCADHYDAIDLIKEEFIESRPKHGLVVACCGTPEGIDSTIMSHIHDVPEHSIGVILCDPVEFHQTFESLQHMANERAAEIISAQSRLSDIGEFALQLMQKTFEQVEEARETLLRNDLLLNNELFVGKKQRFFIPRNQRITVNNRFSNKNFCLPRKILKRWNRFKIWADFF